MNEQDRTIEQLARRAEKLEQRLERLERLGLNSESLWTRIWTLTGYQFLAGAMTWLVVLTCGVFGYLALLLIGGY